MSVAITLLGRDFHLAPYKLGAMRKAAPLLERINATTGALTTLEGAVHAACDMAALLSIGLVKLDPALTPEALEEQIGMDDLAALQKAVMDVLAASGLRPGEATAPSD
jgi:hypothetical protein